MLLGVHNRVRERERECEHRKEVDLKIKRLCHNIFSHTLRYSRRRGSVPGDVGGGKVDFRARETVARAARRAGTRHSPGGNGSIACEGTDSSGSFSSTA